MTIINIMVGVLSVVLLAIVLIEYAKGTRGWQLISSTAIATWAFAVSISEVIS